MIRATSTKSSNMASSVFPIEQSNIQSHDIQKPQNGEFPICGCESARKPNGITVPSQRASINSAGVFMNPFDIHNLIMPRRVR